MVTTTTLPTLVRVTKSRERPEKVVRVTKEKAQLCRSGEAERALEGRDGKSLDKAFQQYLEYRTVKEPIMEDNRWRNVLKLQTLLTRPEYANIYLAGREHALYEELHRSNPERFVSKSRFMVIMRRVFGFELAPVRGAVDADVKELIEEERVKALRTRLEWCRTTPETAEERAIGRKLQKEAKARAKLVLKRAFKAGVPLELPEAEALALEEVMLKRTLGEERQVDIERTLAADDHYAAIAAREREEREERERNIERVQNNASRAIQKQWELHLSRLELRKRAFERYDKRYDIDLRAFYYVNRRTSEPQWKKPYALGAFDIKLKDEWVVLHDETREPYYYNPQSQAMSWQRPAGTCFCAGCDAQFCAVVCNDTNRKLCMDCYNATHAEKSEDEFNALTFKILKGGDPESGRADIQALEDTGKRLEEERAKQEEEARVARRQSVRRQSSLGRQSAVGAELAKLKSRQSLAAGTPEADALAEVLAGRAEPDEGEEMLDRTQRETSELMAIVEERARRRARRDAGEADEDPAGKRPMLEYRKARRRPSELLRIANGEPDDATTATGNEDKSLVPSTITGGESLDAPGDSLASSLIDALDSFPDPPSEDGGGVKPPRPS